MKPLPRPTPANAAPPGGHPWLLHLLLLATGIAAYFPALNGNFLWDDAGHITSSALQSWSGLLRIWCEPGVTQQYYPLLHSAFWLEHRLWGDATLGYHLTNVFWHATSATLLIVLLRRLALPGAVLAGFVFALHPVGVESVAWISEQKNTLSTVFALAATLAWLRFEEDRRPARYAIALLWFVAAVLTKSVTATLPGALLVIAWWRRGRLDWRSDIAPLLPWLGLGLVAGLGTAWFEATQIGAAGGEFTQAPAERILLAGRVPWFYLGKLLWPAGLAFFYSRWNLDAAAFWQWLFPAATLGLLAVLFWWRKRQRGPLAAALLFGGTLFPVLGFLNVYPFVFSYVADHFQYLASLAPIAFLVAAGTRAWARLSAPRWAGPALSAGLVLLLGVLTWRQSTMYRDEVTLYTATLERTPSSWVARLNLGTALADAGQLEEALPHLQRALELKPNFPETLNTLGNVLNQIGRAREALPLLERAVQLSPKFAEAHATLGAVLMSLGRADEGVARFRRVVELTPNSAAARGNLGTALANQGRFIEAGAEFERAHQLQPDLAELEFKWGAVLAMQKRAAEALPHLARAVELQPDEPDWCFAYGCLLLELGRSQAAQSQFEATLRLAPDHPGAQQGLERLRQAGLRGP